MVNSMLILITLKTFFFFNGNFGVEKYSNQNEKLIRSLHSRFAFSEERSSEFEDGVVEVT